MAKYRFVSNLSPADRIDRYQVSEDKVLELGGEAVTLTDAQAERARQRIVLEELPEGAADARYGPHNYPDPDAERRARSEASKSVAGEDAKAEGRT